jgi:hypothetical protein
MSNATSADILHHLKCFHQGQHKAVSAKDLSVRFGIRERGIREMIHAMRAAHIPVCTDPAIGIWWPTSREDAQPAVTNLSKLFKPVREAKDGLEAGLLDLFGQDQLELEVAS